MGHFCSFLKQATYIEAAWSLTETGLSLKSNQYCQVCHDRNSGLSANEHVDAVVSERYRDGILSACNVDGISSRIRVKTFFNQIL